MVVSTFHRRDGVHVRPTRPVGEKGPLDFGLHIEEAEIDAEVKAPEIETAKHKPHRVVQARLKEANTQFVGGRQNLLVLVPDARPPTRDVSPIERARNSMGRLELVEALIGPLTWQVTVVDSGSVSGGVENVIPLRGQMTRPKNRRKGPAPAFRNISAVAVAQEVYRPTKPIARRLEELTRAGGTEMLEAVFRLELDAIARGELEPTTACMVVHNPNAACAIAPKLFGDWPQFQIRNEVAHWTDGHWV